jgi:hypothetical protein
VLGNHGDHGDREELPGGRQRSRGRALAVAVVVVVIAGGAVAIAQSHDTAAPAGGHAVSPARPKAGRAPAGAPAANRQQAAAWVAAQVSRSVIVSCDPVMCSTLEAHHFPAGDLLPLSALNNDPMGSAVVVSTEALRSQFGHRLPDVYAPVVLASFGTGTSRVEIRVEAPDGARAYLAAERADLLARQSAGRQLLGNKALHVTGASRQAIAAGTVDSRILITLAALAAQVHHVYVARFGGAAPGATPGVPARMVQLDALTPAGGQPSGYLVAVQRFLRQQQAPFLGSTAVLHLPGQRTVVQITFAAPSPFGLLGASTSP